MTIDGYLVDDREMLVRAGAALNMPVLCYESRRNCLRIGSRSKYFLWNPLDDNATAFRLMVDLGLELCHDDQYVKVFYNRPWRIKEPHGKDRRAAVRRAIVRAAAAIGGKKLLEKNHG